MSNSCCLDILKEKTEHIDGDRTFMLSLVPAFKKLIDDQKYWVKMEMLGIMKKAKSLVFQPQYVLTSHPCTYKYHFPSQNLSTVSQITNNRTLHSLTVCPMLI